MVSRVALISALPSFWAFENRLSAPTVHVSFSSLALLNLCQSFLLLSSPVLSRRFFPTAPSNSSSIRLLQPFNCLTRGFEEGFGGHAADPEAIYRGIIEHHVVMLALHSNQYTSCGECWWALGSWSTIHSLQRLLRASGRFYLQRLALRQPLGHRRRWELSGRCGSEILLSSHPSFKSADPVLSHQIAPNAISI